MKKSTLESSSNFSQNLIRYALGILLAFMAINALGGGYYGMSGANAVPLDLLDGSPFSNYFIPGLILFTVIGGTFLFSSVAVFTRFRFARLVSFISVIVVIVWLAVQITIIGYVSWMQPATAILAIVILVLTWLLPAEHRAQ